MNLQHNISKEQLLFMLKSDQLDMFEAAQIMRFFCTEHHMSQAALAKLLGVNQSTVGNKIRLLQYSDKEIVLIKKYCLTERHARTLLRIQPPKREKLIESVGKLHLSVQQTEDLVEKYKTSQSIVLDSPSFTEYSSYTINAEAYISQIQQGAQRLRNIGYKVSCMVEANQEWKRIVVTIKDSCFT